MVYCLRIFFIYLTQNPSPCIWCPGCAQGIGRCIRHIRLQIDECSRFRDTSCDKDVQNKILHQLQCPKSECRNHATCQSCMSEHADNNGNKSSSNTAMDNTERMYKERRPRMTEDNELESSKENRNKLTSWSFKCNWKQVQDQWTCIENIKPEHIDKKNVNQRYSSLKYQTTSTKPEMCPLKCFEHKDCSSCIKSNGGGDGPWNYCSWSVALAACLSPPEIPLRCLGGLCGMLISLQGRNDENGITFDDDKCPKPCSAYTQCKTCLERTRCGWCSVVSSNGVGKCIEGTIKGPNDETFCDNNEWTTSSLLSTIEININSTAKQGSKNRTPVKSKIGVVDSTSWHFSLCPQENECLNNHHDCDASSEICLDKVDGFSCQCSKGFEASNKDPRICVPLCNPRCEHGKCVAPNQCQCDFSFVGSSCEILCDCNGHSNCAGSDPKGLTTCLECKNNTMGNTCEFCKPFHVGDPTKGIPCVSCSNYCNNHSELCFDPSLINSTILWSMSPSPFPSKTIDTTDSTSHMENVDLAKDIEYIKDYQDSLMGMTTSMMERDEYGSRFLYLEKKVLNLMVDYANNTHGPKDEAVCVNCKDDTTGLKCDRCFSGSFRTTDDARKSCKPCDCNGHGNICNEMTGSQCVCQNNTISDTDHCKGHPIKNAKNGDRPMISADFFSGKRNFKDTASCQKHQCSKCKEYYVGYPTDSHQCYRQMTVDTDYCLDPITQSKCWTTDGKPDKLQSGQTVYFAVLPKFMNVDIRVIVDVKEGNVDVFFSPEPQMFIVNTNQVNWNDEVRLDPRFSFKVTEDEDSSSTFPKYQNKLWHKEYYGTDPLFKLIKEKQEKKKSKQKPTDKKQKDSNPLNQKKEIQDRLNRFRSFVKSFGQFLRYEDGSYVFREKLTFPDVGSKATKQDRHDEVSGSTREKRSNQASDKNYSKEVQFLRRLTRLTGRRMSIPAQLAKNITSHKAGSTRHKVDYEYIRKDCDPNALHTLIPVFQPNFVLHARNLRNRLVISLPDHLHELRSTRFFLIIQSTKANATKSYFRRKNSIPHISLSSTRVNGHSVHDLYNVTKEITFSTGSLVFRQDQLHIDLFVFFSVFFSCFFLFLSFCVIVWKFKSMSDIRNARRRHVVEMQYMAQRPFASQLIMFEQNKVTKPYHLLKEKNDNDQVSLRSRQLRCQPPLFEPYRRQNHR